MESDESLRKKRDTTRAVAPADCPEFKKFMSAVEADSSISEIDMLEMFRDLGVYGHLTELGTIILHLQQVLDLVMERPSWQPYLNPVKKWPALLDWIKSHESILPPSKYTAQAANKNPLVHVCATSHPLYTLLWTSTEPNQLKEFRLLQGYVLIAHLFKVQKHAEYGYDYVRVKKAPYEELVAGTYRSSVALREISVPRSEVLPDMLRPDRPPLQFAEEMLHFWQAFQGGRSKRKKGPASIATEEDDGEAREEEEKAKVAAEDQELFYLLNRQNCQSLRTHLQSFCYSLAEVYELRKHGMRSRSRPGSRHSHAIHGYLPLLDTIGSDVKKPDDDPSKRTIKWRRGAEASASMGSKPIGARRYQEGFDIDEAENLGDEYVELESGCALAHGSAPSLLSLALQGKMQAEALDNQLLPWDYDLLTDTAVRSLVEQMAEDFPRELAKSGEGPSGFAEAIALLSILLWTGCGLEVGRKIKILKAERKPGLEMLALEGSSAASISAWRLRLAPPSHLSAAIHQVQIFADVSESILRLPDIAQGSNYFQQLSQLYPAFQERGFARSVNQYRQLLPRYLKQVDPSGYVSLSKVEDYLWRRLADVGDLAEADLIVGKQHRLAQVRRFYTAFTKDALQQRYCEVVAEVLRSLGRQVPSTDHSLPQRGYVGAVYRPTMAAVQKAVIALQNRLEDLRGQWQSVRAGDSKVTNQLWQEHYNQYTFYTWLFFAYSTAARATCLPFPHASLLPIQEGFIVHSDKTTRDHSHVRLLWLPEVLLQQLRDQSVFASSSQESLLPEMAGGKGRDDFVESGNFVLTPRKVQPLCPKALSPLLHGLFGHELPVNSHRRFCRSHLLEVGCPVEVVDAYMGHWFAGESPWSRYSSQSAKGYVLQLRPFLMRMLEDLGFRLVPLPASADLGRKG